MARHFHLRVCLQFLKCLALLAIALTLTNTTNAAPADDLRVLSNLNQYGNEYGTERAETIGLRNAGTPDEELVISGRYSIAFPDTGYLLTVTYMADKNGYVARTVYELAPIISFGISATGLKSAAG